MAARGEGGRLVSFLVASPIPARDGCCLEDILRLPDMPPGTAELLVFEALTKLAADVAKITTLGTSPLAMDGENVVEGGDYPLSEQMLRLAVARLERFYNSEGLRRFKSKFVPSW